MKKQILLFCISLITVTSSFAQWNIGGVPFNRFDNSATGPLINQRRSWGFGDFSTNGTNPLARVHINDFYCQFTPNFAAGQLFRTDGTLGNLNVWTFFTGATAATSTEKFSLYTLPNSSEVNLQATEQTGELIFRTADTTERFRIRDTADQIIAFRNPGTVGLFLPQNNAKFSIHDRSISGTNFENTILLRAWGRGFYTGSDPNGINTNFTLAEFIQNRDNSADAGILIQGSRASGSNADVAFIDLGNNDITNGGDHVLARVAVGIETPQLADPSLERGAYRIYTNAGINSSQTGNDSIGLLERFRITSNGWVGIGNFNNSNGAYGVGQPGYIGAKLDIDGDLRIRRVTEDSTLTHVLVVDPTDSNRVHFRDLASLTGQLGNLCSDPANPLQGDYRIPLNSFDFRFTGFNANPNRNRVSIGLPCNSLLFAKFTVSQNNTGNVNQSTAAIRGANVNIANTTSTPYTLRGIWGVAAGSQNSKNTRIGGDFRANTITTNSSGANIGVRGIAGNLPTFGLASSYHIGGLFYSSSSYINSNISIGVAGIANGGSTSNIGVYGDAPDLSTSLGPNYAGYFNGDLLYTTQFGSSDAMFKTDLDSIDNAIEIIEKLKPRTYLYDISTFQGKINFSNKKQYGFVAQDVETVLPELVGTAVQPGKMDTLGNVIFPDFSFKTLNYNGFFAILTKGIQEQQNIIDSLENLITNQDSINNTLYTMIAGCCSNNNAMMMNNGNGGNNIMNTTDVTLSDAKSIILNSAVPNPFADMTTITYVLTNEVRKAQMLFYDVNGKLINSVDLTPTEGQGRLNVFADDLSNGVYTYTLVADGQIIDTKRMIKNK